MLTETERYEEAEAGANKDHGALAKQYFLEGYNCAQSVVLAFPSRWFWLFMRNWDWKRKRRPG